MADETNGHIEIERATRSAVRDILLGSEGQLLMSRVAEEAARTTLTDFMLKIGMDTTSPQSILALQLDMQHLRWWNNFVSSGTAKVMGTIIVALTTGAIGVIASNFLTVHGGIK